MTIYISGAISSDPNFKQKFETAQKKLEARGFNVLSPTMINPKNPLPYWDYMAVDFCLIGISDAVYFLRDWERSPGARAERRFAEKENKLLFFEEKERT